MSEIPYTSRAAVLDRQRGMCFRCVMHGTDWHHRRGRSVVDEHTHCPCNGVLLCRACHRWVHANPMDAMDDGLIVRRNVETPYEQPMRGFDGWWSLTCTGAMSPMAEGFDPVLPSVPLPASDLASSSGSGSR